MRAPLSGDEFCSVIVRLGRPPRDSMGSSSADARLRLAHGRKIVVAVLRWRLVALVGYGLRVLCTWCANNALQSLFFVS